MPRQIRKVDYYYTTVRDRPGEAYRLLFRLSAAGLDLLAFHAIPAGVDLTQLVLFPRDPELLQQAARERDLELDGPHHALLVQGDDELGALTEIHRRLFDAGVNVSASGGVADGRGGYGYVIYVGGDDIGRAEAALGI